MKKKLLSILLVLCLLVSMLISAVPAAADSVETYAQATVQGSAILHCFDWSYNAIKAALPEIAAAGYTAVQTSPVQQPKDYNAEWTNSSGQWWKLYQPLGLSISDADAAGNATSWLGTKAELTALCAEAETYQIKVIVDIVANHLANSSEGGTIDHLSPDVDPDLQNAAYFHSDAEGIDYSNEDRYNITHRHMGMPDLNTGNSYIQQKVLALLEECIDCGVDGFRFDAAKHIELPDDPVGTRSDFWSVVINGAQTYAASKSLPALFIYGEILGGPGANTSIDQYTTYMAVTDNGSGNAALSYAHNDNAGGLAVGTYQKGTAAGNCVLWAESHDTYLHNESTYASDEDIVSAWAIIGARADSTSLFLARPNAVIGAPSSDTTWKSDAVAEVNKFKNHFDGTLEYLSYYGEGAGYVTYIERGVNGVVISKLNGAGQVSLPAKRMVDGVYTDQVTGNTFTVSNGVITGTVGESGVAVVYNPGTLAANYTGTITASTLYFHPASEWVTAGQGARFAMYLFNNNNENTWVSMTDAGEGYYSANVPDGNWTNVIFCRMNPNSTENNWNDGVKYNQTADLAPAASQDCFWMTEPVVWDGDTGSWGSFHKTVYAVNNTSDWTDLYIHYWPALTTKDLMNFKMTQVDGNVFSCEIPVYATGILFHNGSGSQTGDVTSGVNHNAGWTVSNSGSGHTVSAVPAQTYTVVFNSNGGVGAPVSQAIPYSTATALTANTFSPASTSNVFTGWNTEADGSGTAYADGESVLGLSAEPFGTVDLYAQWATLYSVEIDTGIANGTVTTSSASAFEGDTVTLTVTPDSGYTLSSLTVSYGSHTLVPDQVAGEGNENKYSFTMPESAVTVSAVFSNSAAPAYFGTIVETRARAYVDGFTDLRFRMRFQYNHSFRGTNGDLTGYEITEVGYTIVYTSGSEHTVSGITNKVYFSNNTYFEISVVITGIPSNFYNTAFSVTPYLKYNDGTTAQTVTGAPSSASVNDVLGSN